MKWIQLLDKHYHESDTIIAITLYDNAWSYSPCADMSKICKEIPVMAAIGGHLQPD